MSAWTIDQAGVLRTPAGTPVVALEPELPDALAAAIMVAPRVARLVELLEQAEYSQGRAAASSPDGRKVAEVLAGNAHAAVWAEIRRIGADFEAALAQLRAPNAAASCACTCDCGEDHHGLHCRAAAGEVIHRSADRPGLWARLRSRGAFRGPVTIRIVMTPDGPRCERCAWLTARRRGAPP